MKKAVFDTNIIIDYFNGIEAAKDTLNKYTSGILSIISVIELRVGIRGTDMQKMIAQSVTEQFEIIDINKDVAECTIEIRQRYRLKLPDAIIWTTAQSLEIPLITRNTKDFQANWENIRIPYTLT